MPPTDERLVDQAQSGSEQAFTMLLERYYDLIYRIAYKWLGNPSDAEEISQDACIKIGRSIQSFKGTAKFTTWVYRIVVNLCKDRMKQQKTLIPLEEQALLVNEDQNPEQQYRALQLWKIVHELDDKHRDAVLLVYSEGLTHADAAQILDCAEGTVSWYVSEAKKILGRRLQDD